MRTVGGSAEHSFAERIRQLESGEAMQQLKEENPVKYLFLCQKINFDFL
jgi:hypothetical protein